MSLTKISLYITKKDMINNSKKIINIYKIQNYFLA